MKHIQHGDRSCMGAASCCFGNDLNFIFALVIIGSNKYDLYDVYNWDSIHILFRYSESIV